VGRYLAASGDTRTVVADPHARYFGAELGELTLVPGDDARLGETRFDDWLRQPTTTSTTVNQATRGTPRAVANATANN
jgi:hypothetical protein